MLIVSYKISLKGLIYYFYHLTTLKHLEDLNMMFLDYLILTISIGSPDSYYKTTSIGSPDSYYKTISIGSPDSYYKTITIGSPDSYM
jgi:hypothetical protein